MNFRWICNVTFLTLSTFLRSMMYVALFSPYDVLISNGDAMSEELWYTVIEQYKMLDAWLFEICMMYVHCWNGVDQFVYIPFASIIVILFMSRTIGGNPFSSGSRTTSMVKSPVEVKFKKCGWIVNLEEKRWENLNKYLCFVFHLKIVWEKF